MQAAWGQEVSDSTTAFTEKRTIEMFNQGNNLIGSAARRTCNPGDLCHHIFNQKSLGLAVPFGSKFHPRSRLFCCVLQLFHSRDGVAIASDLLLVERNQSGKAPAALDQKWIDIKPSPFRDDNVSGKGNMSSGINQPETAVRNEFELAKLGALGRTQWILGELRRKRVLDRIEV